MGDTDVEPNEGFTVTLSSPVNAILGTTTADGLIENDDASLSIAATSASKPEGTGGTTPFIFTVTRTGDTSGTASVIYTVSGSGGNPADGADFAGLLTDTVNFADGESSKEITVNVVGDTDVEPNEGFTVTLSSPVDAILGTTTAEGLIQNDDASLSIAATSASKPEGTGGTTPFIFTVTRTGDTSGTASATYTVTGSGGDPADAADFADELTGTVNFADGEASKEITINVVGDTDVEPNEGFTVTLSLPVDATLGTAAADGLIENDDASLSIAATSASKPEGTGGTTPFIFTVTRSGDTSGTASVIYTVSGSGGNPADAADFADEFTGTVNFADGEASKEITINVVGDTDVEPNEGFTVTLSSPVNAILGTTTADGLIENDDASVSIAATSASKPEGTGGTTPFIFTVTRTGDTSGTASVIYTVSGSGGNPADAADFAGLLTDTVNFADGESSKEITVNVVGDTDVEPNEGFTVTLSSPVDAILGTTTAEGLIQNDDGGLSISATDAVKAEGTGGTTPFIFTVTRTGDTSGTASAIYTVTGSGGDPADAADFNGALSGTVSFADGESSKEITINVVGDTDVEPNEGFTVTLSSPVNAILGTTTADGLIENDDASLSIAATSATKPEGTGGTTPFIFTVTRTGDTSGTASVIYTVSGSGGNPADGADFAGLLTDTVNFADGESSKEITVNVVGDTDVEPNEGFTVTLSSPVDAILGTTTAEGLIQNDDASLSIAATSASKPEGTGGTTPFIFTVTRTGDTSGTASATYTVTGSGGNPADAADFADELTGTVNFADGEASKEITIDVLGDTDVEPNEGFTVTLSLPVDATLGTAAADGLIENDDASLSIAATSASKPEGTGGTTPFIFTVTRTGDTSGTASATYTVTGSGGNPADAADFADELTGTVNFADGEASKEITINVVGDTDVEPNEGFTVTLSSPVNAILGTTTADGLIQNDDGGLSISATDAVKAEGTGGTTPFIFTVTRTGDTSGTASATYTVTGSGGDPADAADFADELTGTVNFADGEASKEITINVVGDTDVEPNEGFTVTLSSPVNAILGTTTAEGLIENDDASLSIVATSASKLEGNGGTTPFIFTVTRTGETSGTASATYTVTGSGGDPADAADFADELTGTVNFADGEASKEITINVVGDTDVEPNEGFTVTLSSPVNAILGTTTADGLIENDDASLSIVATSASKLEGNGGTTPFIFTVTRTGDTNGTASATYTVTGSGGDPADAADFADELTGTVNFADGESSKEITVNVVGDTDVEPNEGFTVTLSSPVDAILGTTTAEGLIQNDDGGLSISATDALKAEGTGGTTPFIFTVTRTGDTSGTASATYTVTGSGGDPADAADFNGALSGTVSFADGESSKEITVNVVGDTDVEPNEGFTVTLSSPVNAILGTTTADGVIENDDGSLSIAATSATKPEGTGGTTPFIFTVTRTGDTSGTASVILHGDGQRW